MVEPVSDWTSDPRTVWYAETEGARRYHLRKSCRGLKRAEGPIESTDVDLVESEDGLELVKKGRNLCRICSPIQSSSGGN